ncbi:MAG: DUF3014 domain-containing protein [Proteobacteria bacterium]|nr:DUF3014 domain-containing protein [Pseudomonadota bacterium]
MRSEAEERLSSTVKRRKPHWALFAVAAVVVIFVYVYTQKDSPGPVQTADTAPLKLDPPPAAVVLPPAPDIPVHVAEPESLPEEATKPEALTLEQSDQALRLALADAGTSNLLMTTLAADNLVQRCAGVVDGLSQGHVPYKALPIKRPAGKFSIVSIDKQSYMDPTSYQRYDAYAAAIADLNTDTLVSAFNIFRPLLEQAYAGLGYPADEFDNALIRSLDRILVTPELHEPLAVKRKESVYLYVDSRFESLSGVQKLLLRMGPDNIVRIKSQAMALRQALLRAEPG